ncbi:MAG: hypothetical protein GXP33_05675 [Spirochaetes bacterium]|nr:hypothetical protein [Spirochaetota bacterium]
MIRSPFTSVTRLVPYIIFYFLFLTPVAVFADKKSCTDCHGSIGKEKVVHPAVQFGCSVCHVAPHAKKTPELSLMMKPPDLCFMCHDKKVFTEKDKHVPVAEGKCTTCHNPHSSRNAHLLLKKPPGLCFTCHDKKVFTEKDKHVPVAEGKCTTCHSPHSSRNAHLLLKKPPDLCFTCHDKKVFTKKDEHVPVAEGKCTTCHSPHSSKNTYLLLKKPPGLCFTCHGSGILSQKVKHPPAEEGECLTCHNPHSSDYIMMLKKPLNELCTACHEAEGSGRHVLAEYGTGDIHPVQGKINPAQKDEPLTCISCHNPHSSNQQLLFANQQGIPHNLCLMCHTKVHVPLN